MPWIGGACAFFQESGPPLPCVPGNTYLCKYLILANKMTQSPCAANARAFGFADTKPHYELLDGLRGVAALLVVFHHVFEGYAFAGSVNGVSDGTLTHLNHGYLAVDFFFLLSGFVIGYAYDDRWQRGFTLGGFFRRRLIRLHPMVVLAAVVGLVCFLVQGCERWDGSSVPLSMAMLALLAAMFMIPAWPGGPYEVRGNGEMFPLNGPAWSLFFEYIGNILYGLVIHRLPTRLLAGVTVVLGAILVWMTAGDFVGTGMFGVGWTLDGVNFWGGLIRMLFPYTLGMLMARRFRPVRIRGAFWIATVVMTLLFMVPYIPGKTPVCWNGIFEAVCIIVVFPILLWLGASDQTAGKRLRAAYSFLGNLSYPLYIIHYPLFYLFYAWLIRTETYTLGQSWGFALLTVCGSVALAWLAMRFYDIPVRRWLTRKTQPSR